MVILIFLCLGVLLEIEVFYNTEYVLLSAGRSHLVHSCQQTNPYLRYDNECVGLCKEFSLNTFRF